MGKMITIGKAKIIIDDTCPCNGKFYAVNMSNDYKYGVWTTEKELRSRGWEAVYAGRNKEN